VYRATTTRLTDRVESVSIRPVISTSVRRRTDRRVWWITLLLRVMGTIISTAFLTMFVPTNWQASVHEWLGLGPFPRTSVFEYLTRSIAALYGFHGALLLLVSTDPVRYRAIVDYIGILNVTFGVMLIAVDLFAGMPWWWTAFEGPSIIPFGVLLLVLNRGSDRTPSSFEST
jgi:hypothetical protein